MRQQSSLGLLAKQVSLRGAELEEVVSLSRGASASSEARTKASTIRAKDQALASSPATSVLHSNDAHDDKGAGRGDDGSSDGFRRPRDVCATLRAAIFDSCLFAIVSALSLVPASLVAIPNVFTGSLIAAGWGDVDMRKGESPVVPAPTDRTADARLLEFLRMDLFHMLAPVVLLLALVRLRERRRLLVPIPAYLCNFAAVKTLEAFGFLPYPFNALMTGLLALSGGAMWGAVLSWRSPLFRVYFIALLWTMILQVACTSWLFRTQGGTDGTKLALSLIALGVKEIGFATQRWLSFQITFNPGVVAGERSVLRHHMGWYIYLTGVMPFSMGQRAILSTFATHSALVQGVLLQSIVEVATRVTTPYRDALGVRAKQGAESCARSVFGCRGTKNHDSGKTSSSVEGSATKAAAAAAALGVGCGGDDRSALVTMRVFYTQVQVMEMVAEYVSIYVVGVLPLIYASAKLVVPLDMYASMSHAPDASAVDLAPTVAFSAVVQVAAEVVTDVVCVVVERSRRYEHLNMYRNTVRKHYGLAAFSVCYGVGALIWGLILSDHVLQMPECFGKPLCECAEGLRREGFRQVYCSQHYNSSDGIGVGVGGGNSSDLFN